MAREYIYRKIRDAITYGELRPGERLVEKKVCEIYGIGRSPLREALSQLHSEGYVDFFPNRGVTIRSISAEDAKKIYQLLAVLEGYAVESCTPGLETADIEKLASIQDNMKKAWATKHYRRWLDGNMLFHEYFAKACKNEFLSSLITNLRNRIFRYRLFAIGIPGSVEKYFHSHDEILEALSRRNAKLAGKIMHRHLDLVAKELIQFLMNAPHI